MTMLQHGVVPSTGGYRIERSLRFNSADSATLTRTPGSSGNRKTWTTSFWIKRSTLGYKHLLNCSTTIGSSDNQLFQSAFDTSDRLVLFQYNSGSTQINLTTTQVFRDVSAYYHIVIAYDTTQATSTDRVKLYVNNTQVTAFSTTTYPSQNLDGYINHTVPHVFGQYAGTTPNLYTDLYLADFYMVDGSALTPSSFGENDTDTGVWKPKAYTGSYGTNGFKLTFSDNSNTTAATLGKDTSGNGNNWTPNNFSVTAGAGNDSLVDTPTPYGSDTGAGGEVRGNYAVLNPLSIVANASLSNGNLDATNTSGSNYRTFVSTIAIPSGSWYCEFTAGANTSGDNMFVGICPASAALSSTYIGSSATSYAYSSNGTKYNNASATSYGASFTNGDVIGVAFNGSTLTFYKNGTTQGNAFTSLSGDFVFALSLWGTAVCTANFGARPFAYAAPSGFKALCTTNLPTPAIGATASTQASKYFNTVLRNGFGTAGGTVTTGFYPDFIWEKQRNGISDHYLANSIAGGTKLLRTNSTAAEITDSNWITALSSTGYTHGSSDWATGETVAVWAWNANSGSSSSNTAGSITSTVSANTTAGFSIVTYTGNGTNGTVGHGLGVAPSMVIVKNRGTTGNWPVWHKGLTSGYYIYLNTTGAQTNTSADEFFGNATVTVDPSSTVVSLGGANDVNNTSNTYVMYCFAEVAGYSRFGSYVGNGSTDGPFVYTGFRPKFLMVKLSSTGTESWQIVDTSRDPYNVSSNALFPNLSNAETSASSVNRDILSNGFKIRSSDTNQNGNGSTYIYAAFAEVPQKFSLAR